MTALLMPALIGSIGLIGELGLGLVHQAEQQRVADAAAFAGALAYNATIDTSDGTAAMRSSATSVAALNEVAAGNVAVALVTAPANNGNKAVSVTISSRSPLIFSRLIMAQDTLPVTSRGIVELTNDGHACITSLQTAIGGLAASIGLDGGAVINALLCAVSANAAVTVPCGTGINTARLSFNSALPPDAPCNGIQSPVGQILKLLRKQVTDPYALDPGINAARLRATTTALQLSPLPPVVIGLLGITFNGAGLTTGATTKTQATLVGCTASLVVKQWTLTCPSATPTFSTITVDPTYSVNFNTAAAATTRYGFSGKIINNGVTLNFGAGTFNVAAGIRTALGSTTHFGAASLNVGPLLPVADTCLYSICNYGTLTVDGPTSVVLASGLYNGAAATATLGSGTGNSYNFGSNLLTGNKAVYAEGDSTTVLGAGSGDYKFTGTVELAGGTSAGTCFVFGAAPDHDISGSIHSADATVFGAGTYTVAGNIMLGVNGTRSRTCGGIAATGVRAAGVTFVAGGIAGVPLVGPLTGPCAGQIFCVLPGYDHVVLTAPDTGALAKVALVGPALNIGGALVANGLSDTSVSGLFYVPLGPVTIQGGVGVGSGLGQCLELVVAQLLVKQGSIFAAPCKNGGPTFRTARLVS